ncbi:MAG TPA: hypothetical protein VFX98_07015 [Longimicrobiaceae bacterium]|nr:hypothetical protein [Longimicrobiaceae bacterium]
MVKLRYTTDELARLGDALYEREVAPRASDEDAGHFVAIDVESGAYEIDRDELTAIDRVLARNPGAQLWLRRIAMPYTHRFGPRANSVTNPAA